MTLKSKGSIAINPGQKIFLKKKRFSLNSGAIVKYQNFREQIKNNHFKVENGAVT
jgi:hypothetical protein